MTVADLKDRMLRAARLADDRHGAQNPEFIAAIEALPDVSGIDRLAPEFRGMLKSELAKCSDG